MRAFAYYAPSSVDEVVAVLAREGAGGKVLAGGTDLLVQIKERGNVPKYVVSLRDIDELHDVSFDASRGLRIGAAARIADVVAHPAVQEHYPILVQGASLVGSLQIQHIATVVGNLCNAAPSADTAPPLLALDATVTMVGPRGSRTVPLGEFMTGPGRTVLAADELVTAIEVPVPPPRSGGHYLRHTPRKEMDIAVVGVGSFLVLDGERCSRARIALGAVAPTPIRARRAEAVLEGDEPSDDLIARAAETAAAESRPITDQRGPAEYRRHLVKVLTGRTLRQARADAGA